MKPKLVTPRFQSALTWTPVRKGRVYCSPACGGSCTWESYQEASKEATKTLKWLNTVFETDRFQATVFENLGWYWKIHFKVNQLQLTLRSSGGRFYTTLGTGEGGDPHWTSNESFLTPAEAVMYQLRQTDRIIRMESEAFNILKKSIFPRKWEKL